MANLFGATRGLLRGIIQGAIRIGLSVAETAGLFEGAGIEFDIDALHEEASLYNDAIGYAREYRDRSPTELVGGLDSAIYPGELTEKYSYLVEQKWFNQEGKLETRYSSVLSDVRMTPQEILEQGEQDIDKYKVAGEFSASDPQLHAFWRSEE